jgi:hypothetical protein
MPQPNADYAKRNEKVLASFVAYCKAHPQERFWQALRNWSGFHWVCVSNATQDYSYRIGADDTFNWEERNG